MSLGTRLRESMDAAGVTTGFLKYFQSLPMKAAVMAFLLLTGGRYPTFDTLMNPNSLRLALVTVVVMLQLTSLAVVSIMSEKQLEQQERLEISAALTMHADEIVEKTRLFLLPALSQLTVVSQLISDGVLDSRKDSLLGSFFRSQLRSNHWLKGMYLAREDGSLIRAGRFADAAQGRRQADHGLMITKSILVQGENRQVIYEQRNEETGEVLQWDNSGETSDPRQQDWYKNARTKSRLVWSDVFSYHGNGEPTVSASVAVRTRDGLDAGVLSVAIDLHDLTEFIDKTHAGSHLSAVMLDASGRVMAINKQPELAGLNDIESLIRTSGNSALQELYFRSSATGLKNKDTDTLIEHVNNAGEKQSGLARSVSLFNESINWSLLITQPDQAALNSSGNILNSGMRLAMIIIATPGILALLFVIIITAPVYRLHRRATVDQLTRAYNRDEFETRVKGMIADIPALAAGKRQYVVALDLDGFKAINDKHGHSAGDAILKTVVKRLRSNLQQSDIVGRTGGDEFAFTCTIRNELDPVMHLEQLRIKVVSDSVPTTSGMHAFGMTMGLAQIRPGDNADTVFKRADHALISGKAIRKNRTYNAVEQELPAGEKQNSAIEQSERYSHASERIHCTYVD